MPRSPRPWYRKFDGWWMVQLDGKQVKLAMGKKNRLDAERRFHELMLQREKNPCGSRKPHRPTGSTPKGLVSDALRSAGERVQAANSV
jgi:hypothetical protein